MCKIVLLTRSFMTRSLMTRFFVEDLQLCNVKYKNGIFDFEDRTKISLQNRKNAKKISVDNLVLWVLLRDISVRKSESKSFIGATFRPQWYHQSHSSRSKEYWCINRFITILWPNINGYYIAKKLSRKRWKVKSNIKKVYF